MGGMVCGGVTPLPTRHDQKKRYDVLELESKVYAEVEYERAYSCKNNAFKSCKSLEASDGKEYYGYYAWLLCVPRRAETNSLEYP